MLSIQVLRGFAVLLVLCLHLTTLISTRFKLDNIDFFSGRIGVDIFFIISGFIIMYSASRAKISPHEFIVKRMIRIYPLYWIYFLMILFVSIVFPGLVNSYSKANILSSFFLFASQTEPLLNVSWTLVYEVFFYLAYGFLMIFFKPDKILISIFILFLFVVFILNLIKIPPISLIYGSPLLFEFLFGCIIYKLYSKQLMLPPVLAILIVISFLWILFSASFFERLYLYFAPFEKEYYGRDFFRFIYFGFPAVVVVYAFVSLERKLDSVKYIFFPLKLLGDASYSIYLSHYFALMVCLTLTRALGFNQGNVYLYCVIVFCSIFAGFLSFYFIENKIMLIWKKLWLSCYSK